MVLQACVWLHPLGAIMTFLVVLHAKYLEDLQTLIGPTAENNADKVQAMA